MKAANDSRSGRFAKAKSIAALPVVKPRKLNARTQAWIEFAKACLKFGLLGILVCAFYVAVWSSGASPVPVSGEVRYKGRPVPNVTVVCMGKGNNVATGTTDQQGRFAFLTTKEPRDGAYPGVYSVSIAPISRVSDASTSTSYESPPPPPYPSRYLSSDTSPLTISVVADGVNRFELDLKD